MEKIFKWLTLDEPITSVYVDWFVRSFDPMNFSGIDRFLMCYLQYCNYLGIIPKKDYLDAYVRVDGKRDVKKWNIRTDTMNVYDYRETSQLEEAFRVLSAVLVTTYDNYCEVDLSERNFKVDIYEYLSTRKADSIQEAFMQYYPKLTDGSDVNVVTEELEALLNDIKNTYDIGRLKELDFVYNSATNMDKNEYICPTDIACIDNDLGGIYGGIMTTVVGPPGFGKTRFVCIHYAYQVLTVAKKDVFFIETEMKKAQIENILIAYHIVVMFNGRIKIPDTLMLKGDGLTEQQKQIYEAAKIDLFESGKYGKFIFNGRPAVEDLDSLLRSKLRSDPDIKLIVIDYMGDLASEPKGKYEKKLTRPERIDEGYDIVKDILLNVQVSAVCVNQYTAEGIAASYAGRPIRPGMVHGGQVIQRVSDYDLNWTFTEEQELAGLANLSTGKHRESSGFSNVQFMIDKSVSLFRQIVSE